MKIKCKNCGEILDTEKDSICKCGAEYDKENGIFIITKEKIIEKPVEKIVEKIVEKVVEKPVEKPKEKSFCDFI